MTDKDIATKLTDDLFMCLETYKSRASDSVREYLKSIGSDSKEIYFELSVSANTKESKTPEVIFRSGLYWPVAVTHFHLPKENADS